MIRSATLADAPRLLSIYAYYTEHTAISFEYEAPSLGEFETRMKTYMKDYPYLVWEEGGRILGFAYAHAFVGREAYRYSAELTIYLDPDARKKGGGRALYTRLEALLKEQGIKNLYACIGTTKTEDEYLTRNSEQFHAHMGFTCVGVFQRCGYKFGRWYDMIWMEKIIGKHE